MHQVEAPNLYVNLQIPDRNTFHFQSLIVLGKLFLRDYGIKLKLKPEQGIYKLFQKLKS